MFYALEKLADRWGFEPAANWRELWRIVFSAKAILVMVVFSSFFATFNSPMFRSVYARWPDQPTPTAESRFATWDGAHYLLLSQNGYLHGSHSCAFYPLWPVVVHLFAFCLGNKPLLASLILANSLSLVGFLLFYRLADQACGPNVSRDALILMLASPGALFFSFPYTESLYLVLVLSFFWSMKEGRYFWLGLVSFLLPLARPVGVFMLLPLAWHLYEVRRSTMDPETTPRERPSLHSIKSHLLQY